METIRVKGLPEPIAQALEAIVQKLRDQLCPEHDKKPRVKFRTRQGNVLGRLTRREIYEDVV